MSLSTMPLDTNSPFCLLVLLPDPVLTCDLLVFIHSFVVSLSSSSPPPAETVFSLLYDQRFQQCIEYRRASKTVCVMDILF